MSGLLKWLEGAFGRGGIIAWHGIGEDPLWPAMHATPERLGEQLGFLAHQYSIVTLSELLARWNAGRGTESCVALTFDDAYLGVADFAAPMLAQRNLPATIFVSSEHAASGGGYWWDLAEVSRRLGGDAWSSILDRVGLPALSTESPEAMEALRNRILCRFAGRLPAAPGDAELLAGTCWRSLDFARLEVLARDPRYDFACHTVSHPVLPFLPPEEREREIRQGMATISERLGRALPVLAYPYGLYDRETIGSARRAGMIAGLTMEGRAPARRPNPFTIPRIGLGAVHSPRSIALRLNAALRPVLVLRNRGVHPRLPADPVLGQAPSRSET